VSVTVVVPVLANEPKFSIASLYERVVPTRKLPLWLLSIPRSTVVTGTVTEYVWTNPHVLVKVDVKDEKGAVQPWVLEAWNPVTQTGRGWTKNTFKPGDEVSLGVNAAKNGQPIGEIRGKIVINGNEFKQRQ